MILDIMVLKDVFVQFSDSWEKQNIKTASCQLMVSISFYVLCSSIPLIFLQGPISSDCPAVADRLLPGAWKSTEIYGSRWKCRKYMAADENAENIWLNLVLEEVIAES